MKLFIAIPVEKAAADAIDAACAGIKNINDITWADRESLHITLKYLGETPEDKLPEIKRMVDACAENCKKFKSASKNISAFPSEKEAKIIWADAVTNADKILGLAAVAEKLSMDMGFENDEREYVPHITLARHRFGCDIGAAKGRQFKAEFGVDTVALYESKKLERNVVYEILYKAKLK